MLTPRAVLVVLVASIVLDPPSALRVIRTTPAPDAASTAVLSVTFDRPVAGSLDQSVDPATVLTVTPAIQGTLEWRDPVTIRLKPVAPLRPGATYAVTVNPGFAALDGSHLAEPYRFAFRVSGPRVLSGLPVGPDASPKFLTPNQKFTLALSAPADPQAITRVVSLELGAGCSRLGAVKLVVVSQTVIGDSAAWQLRDAGGWDRDRAADSLRRAVTLAPAEPLPLRCAGALVTPTRIDDQSPGEFRRWPFATYGAFRVDTTSCGSGERLCPAGPIQLAFSTPVKGADLLRALKILPALKFNLVDTAEIQERWTVWADLKPKTGYLVDVDPSLVDAFGQRLTGNPRGTVVTTGFSPNVSYNGGRFTVERNGPRTFAVTYVNVDSLEVITAAVPESLEARLLSRSWYSWNDDWPGLAARATHRRFKVGAPRERHGVYGIPFDAPNATAPGTPTLFAVKVSSGQLPKVKRDDAEVTGESYQPIALVQITDLGIHAKVGAEEGNVWITGVGDGKPRAGVLIKVRDAKRRILAQGSTDARGLFRFAGVRRKPKSGSDDEERGESFQGYIEARLGADRALAGVSDSDPDLNPWQFNVSAAYGADRYPMAGAVFTERGIYRPGDTVFAKVIVRAGSLGVLKVPARSDSARIRFEDREGGTLRERVVAPSPFGTAASTVALPSDAPLGQYAITVALKREGEWQEIGRAGYKVAEYRAPEFLVDVTADTAARQNGDQLPATIAARYLFGAPMARAKVTWSVRQSAIEPWDLVVPKTDGYFVANRGWWWEEWSNRNGSSVSESRTDSLDQTGQLSVKAPLVLSQPTLPARISIEAVVTDVNRQSVFGTASVVVHPTSFYIGAKPSSATYFWTAGSTESIDVIAVRPDGDRVPNVAVRGYLIRREWHQVRRESDGLSELVGEWVQDTVDRCEVRTAAGPAGCRLTPKAAGSYTVAFGARDPKGRDVSTSFYRWVTGPGWVPWADESQFKMDVVPDKSRYQVGDTATVLFASPFTNAEAWVTVEREGVIDQRRITITDGATTLKLPVTEAWSPNAFVSIVVARGRSAKPGPLDDPGRPTIRVGYAEVRVTPEKKRLAVTLTTAKPEYRPAEQAVITASVKDAGRGVRSEVTLWAVDEGVLSLTGYRTPNPIDLLYQPRGLGLKLASNMANVAPQVAAGDKGRNPGGGGGAGGDEILRSRFRTTAFFLASVVTDSNGVGTASVKLPDNLTTFRIMAVAVTAGDRYGSGQLPMLVTRPLLARAALPRFVRPGDRLTAGVVVNHRTGGTPSVDVAAQATGITLEGPASKSATLEAGRGREVRFDFKAGAGDSAAFRFDVAGAGDRDAVRLAIPIRPAFRPRMATVAGVVTDSTRLVLEVSPDVDPAKSRLVMNLGNSPVTLLKGYADELRVYSYYCSEQVASVALPLVALYRARKQAGAEAGDTVKLKTDIVKAVGILVRRQRDDGAIGLWSRSDWSSAWLTAEAGSFLLEAKAAGLAVEDTVVKAMAGYLTKALERQENLALSVAIWESEVRANLAERVAVAEFLSRAGRRNRPLENDLVRRLGQMATDDRLEFAITLVRGGDLKTARRILEPLWSQVTVEGRSAVLPDSLRGHFYFASAVRLPSDLLLATLAVEPSHPLLGPLLETVVTRGRAAGANWWWNTQDFAAAVRSVDAWQRRFPPSERRAMKVRINGRVVFATSPTGVVGDSVATLASVGGTGGPLAVSIQAEGPGSVGFFYLGLTEVPLVPPVNPDDHGIRVERWYENYVTGKPTTSVVEGDLVRVRLRLTIPSQRAFVVLDDPLPAGLEAVDLSLKTAGGIAGPGRAEAVEHDEQENRSDARWSFGSWDSGWWSPFDHRELRDDRVVYSARALWGGSYTATYLARATTPGTFGKPQAHAEEMYNPAVYGRSDGGTFIVTPKAR